MWIPRSEAEITAALETGSLVETSTFDAKQALPAPGKNKDLARDICAMTVDGGVLLYGVGGEDPTRPKVATPFALAGIGERIDQVAQTAISEPPVIEITDIPSDDEPATGYLAVAVPASPRAPHMVTLEGENRFYGRGATGNRILTEGEVARLYVRRERWERDSEGLLQDVIDAMPFSYSEPLETIGPMVVVTQIPGGSMDLLTRACRGEDPKRFLFEKLLGHARATDPLPNQDEGLGEALQVGREGADRWILTTRPDLELEYQARVQIDRGGRFVYWHSPSVNLHTSRLVLMEQSVTRALTQAISTAGWLYGQAGYMGAVDLATAVLDIAQVYGASIQHPFGDGPQFGAADYRRHERVMTTEMLSDPRSITRRLLMPLYEVISVSGYEPFANAVVGSP